MALISIMALYLTKPHFKNVIQQEMPPNPSKTLHSTMEELELSTFLQESPE
jgi:hypothetical protein